MKRLPVIVIVLSLIIGLSTFAWAGPAMDRIKSTGVLKVASTATGVPITFMDKDSGKIVGSMVDVMEEVAKYMGVKLEVVETAWTAIIPSLQARKVDLVAASMVITPQRQEIIDFSVPVMPFCEALVVKAGDTKSYKSVEDIRGLKIGAQLGTTSLKGLEDRGFKDVGIYDNNGDLLMEIANGRIDACLMDGPIAKWKAKDKTQFKARLVETYEPAMCADIAIGVNKESKDLLEEVNKAVEKMKKEGKIQQILAKWGQ